MILETIHRDLIDFGNRRREDYGDLEGLAKSIKEKGLIQPIAVWKRPNPPAGTKPYLLLAGGRRFQATFIISQHELPCRVFDDPELDDLLYREIELIENFERKDLSWTEQVRLQKEINELMIAKHGVKQSSNEYSDPSAPKGWSQRNTADLLGKSPATVSADLKLADMLEKIPQLAEVKNKADATKLLKKLEANAVQEILLERIQEKQKTGGFDAAKQKLMDSYILRDCLEGMKDIPNGCIDLVEIDPPYAINLQESKLALSDGQYIKDNYNEIHPADYMKFLKSLFAESYRVMSDNSWLICWYACEPWQEVIYQALRDAGFTLNRIHGLWIKPTGQTRAPDKNLANAFEPFYYARKGNPVIFRQGRTNVFSYPGVPTGKKTHPTERPVELMQDVISVFTMPGSRVCVPFAGSGATLLAMANLGLSGFGYDLTSSYRDGFLLRVEQGTPGFYTSLPTTEGLTFAP